MTNTISLQNAKKLYEVAEENGVTLPECENFIPEDLTDSEGSGVIYNLYSTNELLEWLGDLTSVIHSVNQYVAVKEEIKEWLRIRIAKTFANTPQDALCLLAIELIKHKLVK